MSYLGPETSLLPDRVVPHRLTITWAISDAQHYWVAVQTVEPAIDSGTLTTIQNGSNMTQYDTRPPRFAIQVSDRSRVTRDYGFFLENRLRSRYGLAGVPLVIDYRGRDEARGR